MNESQTFDPNWLEPTNALIGELRAKAKQIYRSAPTDARLMTEAANALEVAKKARAEGFNEGYEAGKITHLLPPYGR